MPGQACFSCHRTGRVARGSDANVISVVCDICRGSGLSKGIPPAFPCARSYDGACQCRSCAPALVPDDETVETVYPLTETRSVTLILPTDLTVPEVDRVNEWICRVLLHSTKD